MLMDRSPCLLRGLVSQSPRSGRVGSMARRLRAPVCNSGLPAEEHTARPPRSREREKRHDLLSERNGTCSRMQSQGIAAAGRVESASQPKRSQVSRSDRADHLFLSGRQGWWTETGDGVVGRDRSRPVASRGEFVVLEHFRLRPAGCDRWPRPIGLRHDVSQSLR